MASVLLLFAACSPDDYGLGGAQYSSEDLVEGKAYTVTIDGNRVYLKSLLTDCTPLWITPSGRSQEKELTVELPFAGDYEVTFGADTRAGAVYGKEYTFNLPQNDFSLLSDEKWFFLSTSGYESGDEFPDAETLSAGVSKKWYPCDKDYGLGCTGPIMYMTPYDPENDGYTDEEAAANNYKDIVFGRDNWAPNWDPGFQSWLIPETDPYLDSYMEFSLSAAGGCQVNMYRGESGTKGASTGTTMNGKFTLALDNGTCPTISFTDCYAMHNTGFDEVCANYTQEIAIAELTPYYLVLVTKRTNSEGNWYIVWNFVSEEVKETDGKCIPQDATLLTEASPRLPEFPNLATQLYTTDINGITFVGNELTYVIDEDAPYEIMWWNGAPYNDDGTQGKWQTVINGNYGQSWAPACGDEIGDLELTIGHKTETASSNPKTYYTWDDGTNSGVFFIDDKGQTLTFTDVCAAGSDGKIPDDFKPTDINFLTASNDTRTINIKGNEFVVLACDPGSTLTLGIPDTYDKDGNCNSYRVVNLKPKEISGGQTGPTTVALESDYSEHVWIENGCLRLAFWSYGSSGSGIFKDVSTVKLKKNQTITVTFKLKPGILTWSQTPKCALIDNNIKTTWETGCFDLSDAVTVNLDGETTVSLTNNTGSTQTFTNTCLDLSIQFDGYADGDYTNAFESVTCVIQ